MGLLGLYIPLLENITPLDADQFTRVARCFISVGFFRSMPGDDQETITQQDLTEFWTFLLEQLKSHTSELSSKFEKASSDAESALSVSKQLKVESELKFTYPGNERNYKFNLEVLDHLDSISKALHTQDSAKASQLLDDSVKLIKECNRKIRIADSSEAGWLTVKHYESNTVALNLEDDQRIRAAEREALRVKTRSRAKRQNAERVQGRCLLFSQPYSLRGQFQCSQSASTTVSRYQQQSPDSYNRQRGACRFCSSFGHWWRECPVRLARSFTTGNAIYTTGANPSTSTSH